MQFICLKVDDVVVVSYLIKSNFELAYLHAWETYNGPVRGHANDHMSHYKVRRYDKRYGSVVL